MTYALGFDIGGTFTDFYLLDRNTGEINQEKVPTTPEDFAAGVIDGITKICEENDVEPDELSHISHGTTVATNAMLEQDGATTGLITTEGFRDVLAIGREKRSEVYNCSPSKIPTFTDRENRLGVTERLDARGQVRTPLDETEVEAALSRLQENGVESIAVSLIHAYQNDVHEERVRELVGELAPETYVSTSSAVMPEIQEYERTLSTVIDAYVGPTVQAYIANLESGLRDLDIDEPPHLMQANGGVITTDQIEGRYLRLINSGPAAGVIGARQLAESSGIEDIITLDMGGTSADACVVRDGDIEQTTEGEIGEIPLLFSQIDVRTIGAGGGSIAWLDDADLLKVGPRSSGAEPGPACYGRGGTEPTVTDAALELGYLNPEFFLGGEMQLDEAAAHDALTSLSERLGQDTTELSDGILDIVTTNMTQAIRRVTVEKGYDPRRFSLTCYGGAGPMFATRLAREMGITTTVIPTAPGVLSASGLVSADKQYDFSTSKPTIVGDSEPDEIGAIFADLESRGDAVIFEDSTLERSVDMRYEGQTFQLNVDVPDERVDAAYLRDIEDRFHSQYEAIYGQSSPEEAVEAVTWRLTVTNETATTPAPKTSTDYALEDAVKGTREAYADGEFREHTVYDRYRIPSGGTFEGPAIVEETESTTIAGPGSTVRVDDTGNLIIESPEAR